MAQFTEIGVQAVAQGVDRFILQMGAMNKSMQAVGAGGAAAAGGVGLMSAAIGVAVAAVSAAVIAVGAYAAALYSLGKSSVETAASMESAFAGVLKTTMGLGTNLYDLTDLGEETFQAFRDMTKEIPMTFEELSEIGQYVGQLGFAEDQIADVTETVAAVTYSTDLVAREAALMLSRFASVMSETGEVTSEEFENMASDLVFLGNKYQAFESEIILTARNIAGTAALYGISEDAVLAWGTAVIKAGVTAEAGGSSIQNVLTTLGTAVITGGDHLDTFAEVAGMSAENFKSAWETEPEQVFLNFVEGLQEQGAAGVLSLQDLDLAQRRSIRTLLGISRSGINLREIMEDSNMAIQDNTYLMREAEIRYGTFDSKVKILKNSFRDMGLTIGMEIIPYLQEMLDKAKPVIDAIGEELGPIAEEVAGSLHDNLLPALGDLAEAFGIDLSQEGIVQMVRDLGDTVTTHIEDFSEFVTKVAELVELSKEKGLAGFIEGLGVPEEQAQTFADAAVAIGSFVLAVKTITTVTGALAGLAALGPGLTEVGAFLSLFVESLAGGSLVGAAGAIVAAVGPIAALAGALGLLVSVITSLDAEDIEVFKSLWEQLKEIFKLLGERWNEQWEGMDTSMQEGGGNKVQPRPAIGNNFLESLITFFTETLPNSVEQMKEGIDLFVTNVIETIKTSFSVKFAELVVSLVPVFITFAASITREISQQISTHWEKEATHLKNIFREAGKQVVNGFIKGMRSRMEWALAEISAMADALASAAREGFKIGSPSKVFMDIGENVALGLAEGIRQASMKPQMEIASSLGGVIDSGMKATHGVATSTTSVDRSMTVGDINVTTRPESPNTIGLTMQRLALMQQGI